MGSLNPYTAQLVRRVRALPLDEAREVLGHWKYAEAWVFFDRADRICKPTEQPLMGEVRCLGYELSAVIQVRKKNDLWTVNYQGSLVGTTEALSEAIDMAECELELRGYIIPWRRP